MNKLSLIILIAVSLVSSAFAQEYTIDSKHADWRYLYGDNGFYLYNAYGDGVENFDDIPSLSITVDKDSDGTIRVRLSGTKLYTYDDSENDANYYDVDIIIDEGEIISYNGKLNTVVESDNTRIYFSVPEGGTKFTDLFAMMESGNTIYIQTTGSGKPKVFKYSLSGFKSGLNKLTQSWLEWKDDNKNPFNNNPFDK